MPIRLNLLAEAQASEESRRRDPVKRAIWVAVLLVALMLAWSGSVQVKAMWAQRDVGSIEKQISTRTNEFQQVLDSQKKFMDIQEKLAALRKLAANRFLNGTMLNALQQTTVPDVHLIRLRVDQTYTLAEEVKAKTNSSGRLQLGKPASVTEKIVLTLDARDSSSNPGDQVIKFKEAVANHPYFQMALGKTNEFRLFNLQPATVGPDGRSFVSFTLEGRYPEQTR